MNDPRSNEFTHQEGNEDHPKRGFLEVSPNESGTEIVVNLDRDRTGHITFTPVQARNFAAILTQNASKIDGGFQSGAEMSPRKAVEMLDALAGDLEASARETDAITLRAVRKTLSMLDAAAYAASANLHLRIHLLEAAIEDVAAQIILADKEKGAGFDTLASATWDSLVSIAKHHERKIK